MALIPEGEEYDAIRAAAIKALLAHGVYEFKRTSWFARNWPEVNENEGKGTT